MQAFKLPVLKKQEQAMTKKLPLFKAKDVRECTKRSLVAAVSSTKNNNVGARQMYCKSCKTKHLARKHTDDGKHRYKELLVRKRDGSRRKPTALSKIAAVEDAGVETRRQRK